MPGLAPLMLRISLAAGLVLAANPGSSVAQQRVGVSAAVNPDATGTPPGAAARKLVLGQDVIFNERINTGPSGQTQIMFLDESAMTVGPNSDLTIDQFVYDPKSGTGKLAMSATRGLLRYVGGKLSKQDEAVTVRTSTATLAVRGGAFVMNVDNTGRTEAIFIFGDGLTVTGLSGLPGTLRRPGFEIIVSGPGASASAPLPVPPQRLAQLLQQLDGRRGGTGGAPIVPTDAAVVNSGIGQTVSNIIPTAPQPETFTNAVAWETNVNATTAQAINPQPNPVALNPSLLPSPSPSPSPPTPSPGQFAGFYKTTPGSGSSQGFVSNTPGFNIAYAGGQIGADGFYTATLNGSPIRFPVAAGGGSRNFTTADGTQSPFGAISGTSFVTSDGTFLYSNNMEHQAGLPDEHSFVYGGTPVNSAVYQPTGAGLRPQAGSNTRVFAFAVQPDAALQSNMPFIRSQVGGNLPNAAVSPLYVVAPATTAIGDTSTAAAARALQGSLAVNGQGVNQQSVIAVTAGTIGTLQSSGQPALNAQLRGSAVTAAASSPLLMTSAVSSMIDANGNTFYGNSSISGFALDQTAYNAGTGGKIGSAIPSTAVEVPLSGTGTTYGFAQPAVAATVPTVNGTSVGASRTTQSLTGNFGGLMYTTAQSSPYIVTGGTAISTDASTNRVQGTLSGSAQSTSAGMTNLTMQYGSLSGAAGSQAFVDDRTFAALESAANPQQATINGTPGQPTGQLYLASNGVASPPASLLPAGAAYCDCKFLQWGYWGGELTTPSTTGGAPRIDRGHINTWVAGVPTPLSDLGTLQAKSASATYTGHAIGSVFNNGASYIAAGGFNGSYNFGTHIGTMAVSNFDGHSFAATGSAPLNGANYSFPVNSPGISGAINGTFYGPNAAETGGNFAVRTTIGPTYLASGIYAGKQ